MAYDDAIQTFRTPYLCLSAMGNLFKYPSYPTSLCCNFFCLFFYTFSPWSSITEREFLLSILRFALQHPLLPLYHVTISSPFPILLVGRGKTHWIPLFSPVTLHICVVVSSLCCRRHHTFVQLQKMLSSPLSTSFLPACVVLDNAIFSKEKENVGIHGFLYPLIPLCYTFAVINMAAFCRFPKRSLLALLIHTFSRVATQDNITVVGMNTSSKTAPSATTPAETTSGETSSPTTVLAFVDSDPTYRLLGCYNELPSFATERALGKTGS